jgi:hypothetical protein
MLNSIFVTMNLDGAVEILVLLPDPLPWLELEYEEFEANIALEVVIVNQEFRADRMKEMWTAP